MLLKGSPTNLKLPLVTNNKMKTPLNIEIVKEAFLNFKGFLNNFKGFSPS
jgi:hypothetical protein